MKQNKKIIFANIIWLRSGPPAPGAESTVWSAVSCHQHMVPHTHIYLLALLQRTHTISPVPWGAEPCGRTSGFRRWRWEQCRGRGHTGRVWGSTVAGGAAATPTHRWRCWQSETLAVSLSPGQYWWGTQKHTHTHTQMHGFWEAHNGFIQCNRQQFIFPGFSYQCYCTFSVSISQICLHCAELNNVKSWFNSQLINWNYWPWGKIIFQKIKIAATNSKLIN